MRVFWLLVDFPLRVLISIHLIPFMIFIAPKAFAKGVYDMPWDDAVVRGWPARVIGALWLSTFPTLLAVAFFESKLEEADYLVPIAFGFCFVLVSVETLTTIYRQSIPKPESPDPNPKPWNRRRS
jgi:hypothetical protein